MSTSVREVEDALNRIISTCTKCPLNDGHHLPVPGMWIGPSSERPDLFILAEAPGRIEADPEQFPPGTEYGKPLVGPAGSALSELMIELGYKTAGITAFLTNTVKHRPPNNRPPLPSEKAACRAFLVNQLRLLKPKTILALGKHASEELRIIGDVAAIPDRESHYRRDFSFVLDEQRMQVYCTYHPSYALLRNPSKKPDLEKDLKEVLEYLQAQPKES